MKKFVSTLTAAALLASMVPATMAEEASYIAAPYMVDAEQPNPTAYVEPVFYENEGGPRIGVTYNGVIVEDGKYFKDSNNDQKLDVFEDWRLDVPTRVADLLTKMTVEQRVGLMANQLMAAPAAATMEEVLDENGNVILEQLISAPLSEEEKSGELDWGKLMSKSISVDTVTVANTRSGVIRKNTTPEVGAMFNNALNMAAEYDAANEGTVTIPYMLISNPMNGGYPAPQGMAAAVMGDGNYDLIKKYTGLDAQLWDAKGIHQMYGPQIDLITDPRWNRDSGTYTEVPEVNAGIANALVTGYQNGEDGAQLGDVALIVKHFPGDSASENGFESHYGMGQWRVYATEGSLEKYHLVGFQAAVDAGVAGMMPCYSRPAVNTRSAKQTYRGVELNTTEIGAAYSKETLGTLLHDTMGFNGFVNSDSGIITEKYWGADEMSVVERYAACINAGTDVIGDSFSGIDYEPIFEAVESGLVEKEAFDRATSSRMSNWMEMGMFENPYRSAEESKLVGETLAEEIDATKLEANRKSVVLMKNHENTLPLKETGKKVYIASFTEKGEDEKVLDAFKAAFEAEGYTLVEKADEADIAFLDVVPGGISSKAQYVAQLELVDGLEVDQRDINTQRKTGETVEVTTLMDVKKIAKAADAVHANGGIVVASINISNPWILTNLEPYCDALIASFGTSVEARMDVLTGRYNPTGKLPITMVSCNEVIALNEQEIDGEVYDVCVAPNDVPGYAKDEYIPADVLAQSPSGSYAYKDADGNVYAAWFGLSY